MVVVRDLVVVVQSREQPSLSVFGATLYAGTWCYALADTAAVLATTAYRHVVVVRESALASHKGDSYSLLSDGCSICGNQVRRELPPTL